MLVVNNDRIDFPNLELRLDQEVARLNNEPQPNVPPSNVATPTPPPAEPAPDQPGRRRSLRRFLSALRHAPALLRRVAAAVRGVDNLQTRVLQLELDVRARREQLEQLAGVAKARLSTHDAAITGLFGRAADLRGHIDAKIAELTGPAGEGPSFVEQIAMLRREVMIQQQRLTRLATNSPADHQAPQAPSLLEATRHDSLYAAFEDVFRGSRADIKQRVTVYVDRLKAAGVGQQATPVVDIGCGRGEWLELLGEHGMAAYGIDSNTIMVERCTALGLDARHADLLNHLRGLPDASRSAVTAFHVVEHLPFETLVDFFDEALRVLIPGGLLLIETPNPETLRVGGTTFYNDPTHRNPLMPEPLRFIIGHRGFTAAEIIRLHPFTQGLLQEPTEDARLLNQVLFGPQDYAIIARRP
jgi:SAM-dependent methyltransferase